MTRAFALLTTCVLALTSLTVAAPTNTNAVAQVEINSVESTKVSYERRKYHHHKKHHHKKSHKSNHHKKSKKSSKKTTKKSSSSSSSSSGTYSGTATWFKPATEGGSQGACGPDENDNSMIVALNAPQYGSTSKKSSWCGKKISITGPHGTATATINDACPECAHGSLDLTPALFVKVVGEMSIGVGKITWSLV